jgi:hypothetical protein
VGLDSLQWHNSHDKFHENQSTGSKIEGGTHIHKDNTVRS